MGKHHVRGSEEHSDSARLPGFTCWIDQPNRDQHLREDLTDVRELTLKRETGPAVTATGHRTQRDSNAARYRGCGSGDAGTGRGAGAKQEGKRDPGDRPPGHARRGVPEAPKPPARGPCD